MRTVLALLLILASSTSLRAQDGEARLDFGKHGYVTRAQLALIPFEPAVKDLALAAYLPATTAPAGQPLWAYFLVKNSSETMQGLDMRFDFVLGNIHSTTNSCGFTVKPLTPGLKLRQSIRSHTWECGSGSLVDVSGNGYYVAAVDLAEWGQLRPGDYEVSWHYSGRVSNTVRFSVTEGNERPRDAVHRHWRIWQLSPQATGKAQVDELPVDRETWDPLGMNRWYAGSFSAALASGVGDRFITNLEALSASDELLSITADWELGETTDRVTIRLAGRNPKVRVALEKFHLYLLVNERQERLDAGERPMDGKDSGGRRTRIAPHRIDLTLPTKWRTLAKDGGQGKIQAAFLLTSEPLREPTRGGARIVNIHAQELRRFDPNPPRPWTGLVRTALQEIPTR